MGAIVIIHYIKMYNGKRRCIHLLGAPTRFFTLDPQMAFVFQTIGNVLCGPHARVLNRISVATSGVFVQLLSFRPKSPQRIDTPSLADILASQ